MALERSLNDSDDPKLNKKVKKEEDDSGLNPMILSQVPEPSVSGAVVTESPDARLDRFLRRKQLKAKN